MNFKVIILARLSSSRLPYKALLKFGDETLISYIIDKVKLSGINDKDIILATSNDLSDDQLEIEAKQKKISLFRGSLNNVSLRIISCLKHFKCEKFILILGDNPWFSIDQLKLLKNNYKENMCKYVVTTTPELENDLNLLYYPTGTRLQLIDSSLICKLYLKNNNKDAQEHTSFLFKELVFDQKQNIIISPNDGWKINSIKKFNLSINTLEDYKFSLNMLLNFGKFPTLKQIINFLIN